MGLEGWCRGRLDPARRAGLVAAAAMLLFPPNIAFLGTVEGYWLVVCGAAVASALVAPRILAARAVLQERVR